MSTTMTTEWVWLTHQRQLEEVELVELPVESVTCIFQIWHKGL